MYYLAIDTCDWINLVEQSISNFRRDTLLQTLRDLVELREVTLLVPEIVLDEWENNKDEVYRRRTQSLRGKLRNAQEIVTLLSADDAEVLSTALNEIDEEVIASIVRGAVGRVDYLLHYYATIRISITNGSKQVAADLALEKKAPFLEKNRMADALILFSTFEYAKENQLQNVLFVSADTTAFSSRSTAGAPHPDLRHYFEGLDVRYFPNIGNAINEVEHGAVDPQTIKEIDQLMEKSSALQELLESRGREHFREFHRVAGAIAANLMDRDDLLDSFARDVQESGPQWLMETAKDPDALRETLEESRRNAAQTLFWLKYGDRDKEEQEE